MTPYITWTCYFVLKETRAGLLNQKLSRIYAARTIIFLFIILCNYFRGNRSDPKIFHKFPLQCKPFLPQKTMSTLCAWIVTENISEMMKIYLVNNK